MASKNSNGMYVVNAYKPNKKGKGFKKVGCLKDFKDRCMKFASKHQARTTANIESIQIESEGIELIAEKRKK